MTDSPYVAPADARSPGLWRKRAPLLRELEIELTERCNLRCVHCYINRGEKDRRAASRELDAAAVGRVLEEAAALGCLDVKFTGGEPLLRPDFEEIYLKARRLGLKATILTNATLLTPRLARLFAAVPPLEKIEVSVYGARRATYESVTRRPGSYAAMRRGLRLLARYKIPHVLRMAVLPGNRADLPELEAWAAGLPWTDRPLPKVTSLTLRGRRDGDARNEKIKALRLTAAEETAILARDPGPFIEELRGFLGRFGGPPGDKLFTCGAGRGRACLDAYGRLQPCLLLRAPEATSDAAAGLRLALTEAFPRLRTARAKSRAYLARCARCFLKPLCEQCPAKSWIEHGRLDEPVESLCRAAHAQARLAGVLREHENAWEVRRWRSRLARLNKGVNHDIRKIQARPE